jgi:hypothetical protein
MPNLRRDRTPGSRPELIADSQTDVNGEGSDAVEPLPSAGTRSDLAKSRNLARFQPPMVDYLKAQVLTAEGRYSDAEQVFEKVLDRS